MLRGLLLVFNVVLSGACVADQLNVLSPEVVMEVAESHGIDPLIFLAVIQHESGEPQNGWQINPWALNIGGKGIYPKSRSDAYKKLLEAVMAGERTIGIGPGQIEWRWHKESFINMWDALDTNNNLDRAAIYYAQQLGDCNGDVWCAVGAYHNKRDLSLSSKYTKRVMQRWQVITKKRSNSTVSH